MGLKKYIEKIKPSFEKGGKLQKFHSTFEAFESFLFVPNTTAGARGAQIHDSIDLKRTMSVVIMAVMPAMLFGMWNIGNMHYAMLGETVGFWGTFFYGFLRLLPLILVSYIVGLAIEFASAQIRGHQVNEGYLVTGILIPLIMPIDVPLWILALAVIFAVIIGKEIFGGTGMNIWNPALLARAFVFFAYPAKISGDKVWVAGLEHAQKVVDGFSGATPLAELTAGNASQYSVSDMFFGFIPGSVGETSTLAILIGAAILIYTGIASWKIMLSTVVGGLCIGLLANAIGSADSVYMHIPAWQHLIMGGFAFGAVFMATDPVTSSQTEAGKWIYGFLIGALAVTIRLFNPAYPEGMMLAILLMNTFAPLIDYVVVNRNISKRMKRASAIKK